MFIAILIVITAIALFLSGFKDNVYVQHALSAISVCVCALILDAVIGMWKKGVKDIWGYIIFGIALAVSLFTGVSPVLLVIGAAVAGLIIRGVRRAAETEKGAGKK